MKIYTKKGDSGSTSLLGGTRVAKHHARIEAYGTVDELNSHLGMLRDMVAMDAVPTFLLSIQDRLFALGSELALDPAHKGKMELPQVTEADVSAMEIAMDEMELRLPEMKNFVLPGGHPTVSQCHIARCVCRRAERCVTQLSELDNVDPIITKYLNRLSDYLFVLSRELGAQLGAPEIPWRPRG